MTRRTERKRHMRLTGNSARTDGGRRRPEGRRTAGRASPTAPVAAAAAALCLLAVSPGQAWAASADGPDGPAAYETAEGAKPIKGTAGSGDGPEIYPGTYTDSIGRGEKKYYHVDLDAESSAFISAVAAPEPGSRVKGVGEGLKIRLETVDGSECDGGTEPQFSAEGAAYPVADYATRLIGVEDECQKAGAYLFSVEREGPETSDPGRWPLELRYMSEPGLKGGPRLLPSSPDSDEEPGDDETPAPVTSGEKRQAHGGTGFNDAGALAKGVWRDRIKPGETRFYRVPVDWGQRLNASVELGSANSPGEYPPTIYDGFGITAYNPARGRFEDDPFVSYTPDESAQAAVYTPTVDYTSRFDYSTKTPCLAGWHYLAVTVSPQLGKFFTSTAPLTLRVDVTGTAKAGPKYAGDAHAAGFGVSDEDKEQAEKGQNAAEGERSGSLRIVAYVGIGAGVVLILGLAVWTLTARRRAEALPGAPGTPGALGGPAGPAGPGGQAGPDGGSGTVPLWPRQGPGQETAPGYGQAYGQPYGSAPGPGAGHGTGPEQGQLPPQQP